MNLESGKLPQARRDDVFVQQLDDELLVYDAKHHRAHRLNLTAAWVWQHCDGQQTVAQATQLLSDELQQPLDEELVWLSLETLDKANLLSAPLPPPSVAANESRRAMIQKMVLGGTLMFLLPAITPLTNAARAQDPGSATASDSPIVVNSGEEIAIRGTGKFTGVMGEGTQGVYGRSKATSNGYGVAGRCDVGIGVFGTTKTGTGVYGAASGKGGKAGVFQGDVEVTGDIRLMNADCAEDFDIVDTESESAESIEAGTVMVLCDEGALQPSNSAYDKRVAGVLSGAGDYQPGLILDKKPTGRPRRPVALMGKVFCKADARYGAIAVGDLLTTSDTPGHAMKANDPAQAFGTIVGKALRALPDGQGLIPILVSLQ